MAASTEPGSGIPGQDHRRPDREHRGREESGQHPGRDQVAAGRRLMTAQKPPTALAKATAERAANKRKAAERALKDLVKTGQPVTVTAVARRAGVSANYLYQHRDLYEKIAQHRDTTRGVSRPINPAEGPGTIESTLRVHIRNLEAQHNQTVAELRQELASAEQRIQHLTAEIIRLRGHR